MRWQQNVIFCQNGRTQRCGTLFVRENVKGKDAIMPEISRFYGIIIGMYNADHNPPHFHVRYNDYRATIDIQTGEVEGRLPRRVLNMVYEWLDLHKDELIANWKRMENGEMMVEIKPLD